MAWLETLPPAVQVGAVLAALALLAAAVSLLFGKFILVGARRLASRTRTEWDDLVLRAIHPAIALLVGVLVIHLGLQYAGDRLPAGATRLWSNLSLAILVTLAAVLAARLLGGVIRHGARATPQWQPAARLGNRIGNVVVYLTAFLVVLGSYGIAITPIITSLGIAGLAVALALQDTLANFFAGVWIQTGRSLQPGHYVRLENEKLEGYIEDVGWRATRIRQLGNNITVVPNSKFAQAIVTDFNLPVPRMSTSITVTVAMEEDADRVERVLNEVGAQAAKEVPGMLDDPAPSARLSPGIGEWGLQFTLGCHVREFVDQYLVQHELRKRVLARFRQEGIRIPYPVREIRAAPEAGAP